MNYQLQLIGEGRNRSVFLLPSGKYVLKVPKNFDGELDNWREARRFKVRKENNYLPLARCKMVPNSHLLVMEFVNTKYIDPDERPRWTDFIDCAQVGYTGKGILVAYDYGGE